MSDAPSPRPPVVLIIRDGWGENPHPEHDGFNAIKLAKTPVDRRLRSEYPHTLIRTSGEDVGLPSGTMGNSEVGHQNIGAGRIVDQEVMRITRAIRDGAFFENEALRGAFEHARSRGTNVHLMGLLSDGQVHAHIEHLLALIDLAVRERDQHGFDGDRLFLHLFTDGRDTGPKRGLGFAGRIEKKLAETGVGRIASVIGRYYAMDRDHRWERTAAAYEALTGRGNLPSPSGRRVGGEGAPDNTKTSQAALTSPRRVAYGDLPSPGGRGFRVAHSPTEAIQSYYDNPTEPARSGDEFIEPTRIVEGETNTFLPAIDDGDAVIFFNFRGDRPRQLTKAFVLPDDQWNRLQRAAGGTPALPFDRGEKISDLYFCTMTGYEEGLPVTAIAFRKPAKMKNILGEVVANAGLTQFRCAETEKFAHVTFFFNDYREQPFEGESRLLCPSPKDVSTYDQKPEMSAYDVRDAVVARLKAKDCEALIVVNFANPDMVGHTGSLEAAIAAVETVDECVGDIIEAALERKGAVLVTADHGNAEQMWSPEDNSPHTSHTVYDVPLIVIAESTRSANLREGGRLADIAPTVLALMGLDKPAEMTGESLVVHN